MKRTILVAAVACFVLALASPALATAPVTRKTGGPAGPRAAQLTGARQFVRSQFVPIAKTLTGNAAINGTVLDYSGNPYAGVDVGWWVDGVGGSSGTTDGTGSYSFTGIPAATNGAGEVLAAPTDSIFFDWWGLNWSAPGPTTFDMQPGALSLSTVAGGPWSNGRTDYSTEVYTTTGPDQKSASSYVYGASSGPALALPGTTTGTAVYFWTDEGDEVLTLDGLAISAGSTRPETAQVYESSAKRVWTGAASSPSAVKPWGSGKPGASVKIWFQNFPYPWVNDLWGYGENPSQSAYRDFGNKTSSGTAAHSRSIKIPTKAVPGYSYRVWVDHTDGALNLGTFFQVCTLKASKTSIRKGTAIRLSGTVPTQGHWGKTAGKRKRVYIYVHKGTAHQPTTFSPGKQGWKYVGSVRTDRYGKYRTRLLKPLRTLTFVVGYPGDNWYYSAYTSVRKVRVR